MTVYTWDVKNRLVRVADYGSTDDADLGLNPAQVVRHVYDVNDRWLGKQVDADGDGEVDLTERYVYDGDQIVYRFVDADHSGAAEADELANRYLWGAAVDQLLAQEDLTSLTAAGEVLWALTDNLGTVRDLVQYDSVNDATDVALHLRYAGFGKVTSQTGAAETIFQFTARPFEGYTALQQNWHRWYDSDTGRWMSGDPIEDDPTNNDRYVGNNPTNATDPTGLFHDSAWLEWWREREARKEFENSWVGFVSRLVYDRNDPGSMMPVPGAIGGRFLVPRGGLRGPRMTPKTRPRTPAPETPVRAPTPSLAAPSAASPAATRAVISAEMRSKILWGQRVGSSRRIIGGHSGAIYDHLDYAIEVIETNPNGTRVVKYVYEFLDGTLSRIKKSTLFPESWTDQQIMHAVQSAADSPAYMTRVADRGTFHKTVVNGVEVEVIRQGDNVTAAYPTGN